MAPNDNTWRNGPGAISARRLAAAAALLLLVPVAASMVAPARAGAIDPTFRAELESEPGAWRDAVVTLAGPSPLAAAARLADADLRVLRVYDDFGVAWVAGAARDLAKLGAEEGAARVVPNLRLALALDTATVASRAREAWDAKSTSVTPVVVDGQVVDGRGVGIAVVDTGLDASHPDLAGAVAANRRWVCPTPFVVDRATGTCYGASLVSQLDCCVLGTALVFQEPATGCTDDFWVDLPVSDDHGHGTHVGGIAAGRGDGSHGRYAGVAPGARLVGLGSNMGVYVVSALEALHWVHCHYEEFGLRVVVNAWGAPGDFDPADPINRAVDTLVADGLVAVFAVGNDGGDGSEDLVNRYAKNPTRGVLAVASCDDGDRARRGGCEVSEFSSRGDHQEGGEEWPDVAAPGRGIMAPRAAAGLLAGPPAGASHLPLYALASGTSQATGHVAGVAALLLQARPGLLPADVEDILEDTAFAIAAAGGYTPDPTNPTGGSNPGAGHGLVDALAALADPRAGAAGGSPLPQLSQEPHVYLVAADVQTVAGVQWTVPVGAEVWLAERTLSSGDEAAWPLAVDQPARFRIAGPGGVALAATRLVTDDAAEGTVRMQAPFTFAEAGEHVVESQVDFGGGHVAFDAFRVRAVSSDIEAR